jgi:DNA-binding LacI/PurR family transcriptional regulator
MKDIARKAGVSIATVSRVINDNGIVNDATRTRVLQAIKDLKYQPSRVAKRLRSKGTSGHMLGLLIPDIQNPFYVDVLRGIEEITVQKKYSVIMYNYGQDEKKQKQYLEILLSEAIDGLIAAPAREDDPLLKKMAKDGFPIVCIDRGLRDTDVDTVLVDNRKGAYEAVRYLIRAGYKRIAFISGLETLPTSRHREEGYRDALEEYQMEPDESLLRIGDSKIDSGRNLTRELLSMKNPPDAIFAGNNLMTLGALETIQRMGLRIPRDIAIIGFDDMIWSNSLNPPLSAVRQPAWEIGKRAGELLIQRIEEPGRACVRMVLKTELMKRSSA